ncbi:MAG: DUF4082 domain-containing protein [Clostridia bacterium]|nr:DUF4082 domain-containing protein [Clostridia bacterium]
MKKCKRENDQKAKKLLPAVLLLILMLSLALISGAIPAIAAEQSSQSIHGAVDASAVIWAEETGALLNLGVNFTANTDGTITKVRIFARADESGEHLVEIWNVDSKTMVAGPYTWTVSAPGSDGWIEFDLPEPFAVLKDGKYAVTVSNNSSFMFYPCYEGFFASPVDVSSVSVDINSGCFGVGVEAYPQNAGISGRSFLRDIVFVPADSGEPVSQPTDEPVSQTTDKPAIPATGDSVDAVVLTIVFITAVICCIGVTVCLREKKEKM